MGAVWLDTAMQLAAFLAAGALTGFVAGMMRTGGGILIPPALLHLLGGDGLATPGLLPAAIGTALAANTLLSARAALYHWRRGALDGRLLTRWAVPVVLGGVAGGVVVTAGDAALLLGLLAAALVTAGLALVGFDAQRRGLPPRRPLAAAGLWGFALGAVSAATGAGAGTFGGPLLRWLGAPNEAGHGAAFGVLLGLGGLAVLLPGAEGLGGPLSLGPVEPAGALMIALAASLTAPFGARFAAEGPARLIPFVLAFVMLATGFSLLRGALTG